MRRLIRCDAGAAALEFALIMGAFFALILGVIQIGTVLAARSEVSHALGQVVRLVHIDASTSEASIRTALTERLSSRADLNFDVTVNSLADTGALHVAVSFPYVLSIPLMPSKTITMTVETITPR